ncbi:MAG: FKBP-type peptidyl-prolyl cis-trans isomerase [Flavobacteriales bacterium]|nr:FKBP-type peptidyl-prolyl cis-trans isomerase [Flavobacteriales bacterium]
MKHIIITASVAGILFSACGSKNQAQQLKKPETLDQKVSYGIGYDLGKNLKNQGIELDAQLVAQGIMAAWNDSVKPLLTEEEMNQAFAQFQQQQMQKMQQQVQQQAAKYEAEGQQFMEQEKAKNKNYKVTQSGMMYLVNKEGKGEKPTLNSQVKVHYKGYLIDGTVFDSSYDRGQPAVFPVSNLIKGWQEALVMMSPGANYKLIIPANLAYGNNPPPNSPIKAGSTLIFEMELLEIVK